MNGFQLETLLDFQPFFDTYPTSEYMPQNKTLVHPSHIFEAKMTMIYCNKMNHSLISNLGCHSTTLKETINNRYVNATLNVMLIYNSFFTHKPQVP